jgi:hypothetical protein
VFVFELLYAAQRFIQQHRRAARWGFVALVRQAREQGVESLLDLPSLGSPRHAGDLARRLAIRELDLLYADPEEEYTRDLWDPCMLGLPQSRNVRLNFTGIGQPWLREGAKE